MKRRMMRTWMLLPTLETAREAGWSVHVEEHGAQGYAQPAVELLYLFQPEAGGNGANVSFVLEGEKQRLARRRALSGCGVP